MPDLPPAAVSILRMGGPNSAARQAELARALLGYTPPWDRLTNAGPPGQPRKGDPIWDAWMQAGALLSDPRRAALQATSTVDPYGQPYTPTQMVPAVMPLMPHASAKGFWERLWDALTG